MYGAGASKGAQNGEFSHKRPRMGSGPEHVMVSCFDDPDKHVEVDMSLLESTGCRLGLLIRNSQPLISASGVHFYRAGNTMTRAMLISMLKSMSLGHLVLSEGVTIGEALSVLEYEGVVIVDRPNPRLAMPRAGVAFSKRKESVADSLQSLCERISDAIVQWPRLESAMNSVMFHVSGDNTMAPQPRPLSSTATRIWLRFADRPKSDSMVDLQWNVNNIDKLRADREGALTALATKNPRWLAEGIATIGIIHYRMTQENKAFGALRDQASLGKLCMKVKSLGEFYQVRLDTCKADSDAKTRKELANGDKFRIEIRNSILNSSSDTIVYALHLVGFVDKYFRCSPLCSRIFSGVCADETGSTPERAALKKALKVRGVSVVKWTDTKDPCIRPIVFPPDWKESWRETSSPTCYGPSVLLSFENIM